MFSGKVTIYRPQHRDEQGGKADMEIKNTGSLPVEVPETKEKESDQYVEQLRKPAATFVSSPHTFIRARRWVRGQALFFTD